MLKTSPGSFLFHALNYVDKMYKNTVKKQSWECTEILTVGNISSRLFLISSVNEQIAERR